MNELLFRNEHELEASGLNVVGTQISESWGKSVPKALKQAYDIHLYFVKQLIESASNGDKYAMRTVEDLTDGTITLKQVIENYDGNSGVTTKAYNMLKESFLHTTATFSNAVASCINLTLIEAWDMCTSCWDSYILQETDRNTCEPSGTIEISAVKKGVRNNKQIIEGGVTHSRWQFGENVTGEYCVSLYGDSVEWTWRLEECTKFNLLSAFLSRLTEAHNEGKILYLLSLYAGTNGFNPAVFNVGNDNIVPNNPVPDSDSINAAINLIQHKTDNQGRPICDGRGFVFVTFNRQIGNQILELLSTVETRKIEASGDVKILRGNGIYSDIEVCVEDYGRLLATANGLGGLPYWRTAWFLFTKPQRGKRNAIEMAHYKGFKTPKLFKRMANTSSVTGTPIPNHGDFDTMNREVKIMSGYGGQVQYSQLMAGSLGDNSP